MTKNFFIRRPIFTIVLSLILVLTGVISIIVLPIAKLPPVLPPTVSVTSQYPGASAEVVEATVTTWLEEAINGTPGMTYMSSQSNNLGESTITVTFELGYDVNVGQLDVLDRVSSVIPRLPKEVQHMGVLVNKVTPNLVIVMMLYDDDNKYDSAFYSNYAQIYMLNELQVVPGVGDISTLGERTYAMRIWLKPNELATRKLTASDVIDVIRQQNVTVPAGSTGLPPTLPSVKWQHSINLLGRLRTPEQFGNIVVKPGVANSVVKLKDVANIELGATSYNQRAHFLTHPTVAYVFQPLPGANILQMADTIRTKVKDLSKSFPKGMKYVYPFDETIFVNAAIKGVIITLVEAIFLVGLVIFFFLRDWRSTLIPMITIPVTLLGTFSLMFVFGFSINLLTLFGITLATGLVVDDAIVVIEHIYEVINKTGVSIVEAAGQAMQEIKSAIVASTLSLVAVFVPVSFFPGITGQMYKQFALTIACSISLSLFVSMTLAPALAPLLLKVKKGEPNRVSAAIEKGFERFALGYRHLLTHILQWKKLVVVIFIALLVLTGILFSEIPKSFLPEEDQGYFAINVSGPSGVALQVTQDVIDDAVKIVKKLPGVANTMSLSGYSMISGDGSNYGNIFVNLVPWGDRKLSAMQIIAKFNQLSMKKKKKKWSVLAMNLPSIQGLSPVSGFQMEIETKAGGPLNELANVANKVIKEAGKNKDLERIFSVFTNDNPGMFAKVNRKEALSLGIPLSELFETLQVYISSVYVNDFNLFGRIYQVFVQADKEARAEPKDISDLYMRSGNGDMVALRKFIKMIPTNNASTIYHYNLNRSAEIDGAAAPGVGSKESMEIMKKIVTKILPDNMKFEWTGMSYQEIKAGKLGPLVFVLGLLFVYLVLSAQYESFIQPVVILFAVPITILGALFALLMRGYSTDIYSEVGFVMLIGLATKNAILIVEVANQLRKTEGASIMDAIVEAAHLRLRPILMTSLAFITGIFPMVIATGAGAASRKSIGTTVFGGMVFSTLLGLLIIPVLYVIIEEFRGRYAKPPLPEKNEMG